MHTHRLSPWLVPLSVLFLLLIVPLVQAAITATPATLNLTPGQTAYVQLSGVRGKLSLSNSNKQVVEAEIRDGRVKAKGKTVGTARLTVRDRTSSVVIPVTVATTTGGGTGSAASYTLLAWNDLGMHCMDGDFSVFSLLPPYNNLHAQLVNSSTGRLVTQGVTLTYEALADPDGSINSLSSTKTNFWQYAPALFGVDLPPDIGLTGNPTLTHTPAAMSFEAAAAQFKAEGIPITPYDDALRRNPYPLAKVVARDATGKVLAQARVVLPVSDEMNCAACHAAGSGDAARPKAGWLTDANPEREYKKNILRLHDEKHLGQAAYMGALQAKGYRAEGLLASAEAGKPVLCAACHGSNALGTVSTPNTSALTTAMHRRHAMVKDPTSGLPLDSINNRTACYQCHPGSETKCLRGAMGKAQLADGSAAMGCQSCHGTMSNVGSATRVGWLEQPNCQACHHDGKRELSAVSGTGILKKWLDTRYATNPDTPGKGFSLYRFSKGHGGLQCEACHGATHAEYPSAQRNDNLLAMDVQGHAGSLSECSACHKSVPLTANKGPHGMHTIGNAWVDKHGDYAEQNTAACAYCHGADYRGGVLSVVKKARSFSAEGRTVSYAAGQKVGCYDCHNGPNGD